MLKKIKLIVNLGEKAVHFDKNIQQSGAKQTVNS